jgi:hypothetical protein
MGGSVLEDSIGGATSSGPVLEVVVLAAEDLKNVNMVGKMSVYVVAWLEKDCKRSTSVRHKTRRDAVWNDALAFPVTDDILLNPHSALTVQVSSLVLYSPKKFRFPMLSRTLTMTLAMVGCRYLVPEP